MNNHIDIQSIYAYPTILLITDETTNNKKYKQALFIEKKTSYVIFQNNLNYSLKI